MLGDVLLGVVMICTFLSYCPQIIKTMKTKKSGDISVESWILWVISSLAYTACAVFSNKDLLLMFETGLELIF